MTDLPLPLENDDFSSICNNNAHHNTAIVAAARHIIPARSRAATSTTVAVKSQVCHRGQTTTVASVPAIATE